MLEAGAQLVYEAFGAPAEADWAPVAHIKLADVAERASAMADDPSLSTGAIYPIWSDQNEFRRELVLHLLDPSEDRNRDMWETFTDLLTAAERPKLITGMVDLIARTGLETAKQSPYFLFYYIAACYSGDPTIATLARDYAEAEAEKITPFYRAGLLAYGRRLRSDVTATDLSRALTALYDGVVLAARSGVGGTSDSSMPLTELLIEASTAILLSFSEPLDATLQET